MHQRLDVEKRAGAADTANLIRQQFKDLKILQQAVCLIALAYLQYTVISYRSTIVLATAVLVKVLVLSMSSTTLLLTLLSRLTIRICTILFENLKFRSYIADLELKLFSQL